MAEASEALEFLARESARQKAEEVESRHDLERMRADYTRGHGKDNYARLKSQEIALERWSDRGERRYRVSIPRDRAQIPFVIPADDADEAQMRYQKLCGIRSTEHEFEVVEVDAKGRPFAGDHEDEGEEELA